jgi:hypothetical protein
MAGANANTVELASAAAPRRSSSTNDLIHMRDRQTLVGRISLERDAVHIPVVLADAEPTGEVELKGFMRPIRAYRVSARRQ